MQFTVSFELYIVIGTRDTPHMKTFSVYYGISAETSQRVNEFYYGRAIYLSVYLCLIIDCIFDFYLIFIQFD